MDYTKFEIRQDREDYKKNLILEGHKKYVLWWLPIDLACDSCMAPMSLLWFMEYLLIKPDDEWFDRWLNEDEFVVGKDMDMRLTRIYMKRFILKFISGHYAGLIDLNNQDDPFKFIEKDE